MSKYILSKSTFIKGLQCEKLLYLYNNFYHLRDEIKPQQQAIFNQGNEVGILAQSLFPNGVDASPEKYFEIQESVLKTREFIENNENIIYEATFEYNGVLSALDILVKDRDGWKAYEVKSSTSVSDVYINDASIQYYTIVNSGIDLKDISIVYINNQYVKDGDINTQKLFTVESVYDRIQEVLPNIHNQVEKFKQVIEQDEIPEIDIGTHCFNPYACDFKGHCWKHIPDYSIFNISRLNTNRKFELYRQGIIKFEDIDLQNASLNSNQLLQITSELKDEIHIDKSNIQGFIKDLNYPLYFLDFETMATAIPIYDGSKPYQQLVFQYSLHIQDEKGHLEHKEYLAIPDVGIDPRKAFVEQLIKDCVDSGDILVYNISFERGKLNDLKELYPQYSKELEVIINKLKDLMVTFQKKWYYTPEMKGSYSIKAVLPALVPELSYEDLVIKEGGTASNTFTRMTLGKYNGDYAVIKEALLEYCKLDTYAMVKILEKLKAI